jgi:NAD(P)-dependent dehydrogenase (short-subunit alcohol dehydrogenase family)
MTILVYTDISTSIKFVRCDVTSWDDQVNIFRTAASMTPSGTIDHVVANAGIAIDDEVFSYDGASFFSYYVSAQTNTTVDRPGILFEAS